MNPAVVSISAASSQKLSPHFFKPRHTAAMELKTKNYETFTVGKAEFQGAANARPALPGDIVYFDGNKVADIMNRAEHSGLVGVLEMGSQTRYGFTSRGAPLYLFTPWNEAYPPFYVATTNTEYTKNVLAVVDFENWLPIMNCPRGSCRRIIGECGTLEAESEALLLHVSPKPWRKQPPLAPPRAPLSLTVVNPTNRGVTFHVDPEGCRDIDDAITIRKLAPASYDIRIHITDVGSYILENRWLLEAANRGQTIYKNGRVVAGMFPPSVEEQLSLLPFHKRRSITMSFKFNDGDIDHIKWTQEVIEITESYTYETVKDSDHAFILKDVASTLARHDLDDPHDWIAQLMLFYNKEAAAILKTGAIGILRRHSPPDMDRLARMEGIDGVPLFIAYSAGEYCAASEKNTTHWGVSGEYCHASSPIRRWADCVNQLALLELVFGCPPIYAHSTDTAKLNRLAKAARAYERDTQFIEMILDPGKRQEAVRGVVIQLNEGNVRVWVDAWKRIIKAVMPTDGWSFPIKDGDVVEARIFYDANRRNWKRKIVFSLSLVADKIEEVDDDMGRCENEFQRMLNVTSI
jgi:RNB domain/Dis3-like cold-shock domain 2 (CSD2)